MIVFLVVEFPYESPFQDVYNLYISRSGFSNLVICRGSDFAGDGE